MIRRLALLLIKAYQTLVSPLHPPCCRFVPSCSEYALQAVLAYGALRGGWLALRRILRCHPLAKGGYDPLPDHSGPGNTERSTVRGRESRPKNLFDGAHEVQ
jgi:hypothetical protein